jgi:EAL domain-containing protein (putative c-di-GMP-specific phosphodiesterase class I)
MGCELAQGYHLARPMPAGEATAWLAAKMAGRFTIPAAERG